jgi:hypothetical protein
MVLSTLKCGVIMKNILLIGDSIRMGYDKSVKRSLDGIATVYFPSENCRFASYVLRYLHEYKNLLCGEDADVVYWNAGLWDCLRILEEDPHTPKDIYAYYIDRICFRINKIFPNAKVIFATSTRVISEQMSKDFKRYNEEIKEYNDIAVAIVKKYGFDVDDLYALSATMPESAHSDAVHYYTAEGTEVFTNHVLECLAKALDLDEAPKYCAELYTDDPIGI